VSALLDPTLSEPIQKFLRQQATRITTSHFDRASSETRVRTEAEPLVQRIVSASSDARISSTDDSRQLGDARWAALRDQMRNAVARGLNGKTPKIQSEAREMMSRFDATWTNLDILLTSPNSKKEEPEQVFAEYLTKTPDFAALWGYAVIAFPPEDFTKELEEVAIGHPSPNQVKAMRDLVRMSFEGDEKARNYVKEFDPDHKLTPISKQADYARALLQFRGPHPIHGYLLYEKEIGESVKDAEAYYETTDVSKYVDKYCPNSDSTSVTQ